MYKYECVCMTHTVDTHAQMHLSNTVSVSFGCSALQCVAVRCSVFQRRLKRPILPAYICSVYTCINMFSFSTPYTCMHVCVYLRLLYMYMQLLYMYRYVSIYAAPILIYICVYLSDPPSSVSMCVYICSPPYIHTCRRIWPPFSVCICLYIVYPCVSIYAALYIRSHLCECVFMHAPPILCINTSMSVSDRPCSVIRRRILSVFYAAPNTYIHVDVSDPPFSVSTCLYILYPRVSILCIHVSLYCVSTCLYICRIRQRTWSPM